MRQSTSIKCLSILIPAVMLCLCGCASSNPEEKFYSMSSVPAVIEVQGDTEFRCFVGENITTGFCWEAKTDSANCEVVINHQGAKSELCGAPGRAEIIVRRLGDEPVEVEFLYRRSFEKNRPPAYRFVVKMSR